LSRREFIINMLYWYIEYRL